MSLRTSWGDELEAFGAYYPYLKTLEAGGFVGDDGDFDLDNTRTMYKGKVYLAEQRQATRS
jgi:hypothetical protein